MTRSVIPWFFGGWFSLIFIVSRFQSILKFNVLYDFAILRMKLGVKGLINVPLLRNCSIVRSTIGWFDIVIVRLGDSVHFGFFRELSLLVVILLLRAFPLQDISPESFLLSVWLLWVFRKFSPSDVYFLLRGFLHFLPSCLARPVRSWQLFSNGLDFFSDLIFSDASTWSSYLHARGSIRAVLPFFSSTFDPSFRMFRRRILGFYLECFGHRFHNCMAIHFSDARLWFIFLLTFSSASISLVVGVSFSFVFVQIIWDTQSTIAWISFPIFGVWAFSNGCRWLLIISQPSCG